MPRARLFNPDGTEREFPSEVLRRYKRRMKQADDAILAIYRSGCNTRRIQQALRPLLRGVPLSKSTVSRLVASLKEDFQAWLERPLQDRMRRSSAFTRTRSTSGCGWPGGSAGCRSW